MLWHVCLGAFQLWDWLPRSPVPLASFAWAFRAVLTAPGNCPDDPG